MLSFSHKPFPQKPLTLAVFSILGLTLASQSHANNSSKITAVTIYQGNASVTRELPISATGEQQVVFGCLSGNLEQNSIQVTASDGVNVGEMNVQTLSGEQAKLCQRQGNQNLTSTQNQLDSVNAKLKSQETTLAYLENFGKVNQLNSNSDIKTSATHIKQTTEETALAITALRQQKAMLESQLASDMNASSSIANRITQVSVKLASRSNGKVTLNYLVNGASWQPQYQANLDTKARKVTLDLQAIVAQTTGENWQNIPLTLSTVQPSYQTALQEPRPTQFSLYDPKRVVYADPVSVVAAPTPIAVAEMSEKSRSSDTANALPLPSYQASINNKSDIVEYQLPQPVTIPSDGRRITTKLDSQSGSADVWVRVVPSEYSSYQTNKPTGYWYAKADLLSKQWTDGQIRLYRDGNYIGTGDFDSEKLTKDGLGFGINKQIIVTDLNSGVTNQTNFAQTSLDNKFSRKGNDNLNLNYRIKNTMNQPITIEMVQAQPVATESQISIKSSFNPPPTTQTWHDKKNMLAWLFNLNPQEYKDISQNYQISYPKDKELQTN